LKGSGPEELYKHVATINADRYTIAEGFIPTGEIRHVGGSAFDLRVPRELGAAIAKTELRGYDNNFCITKGTEQALAFVGRVLHPGSGRFLEVYSDQEGVQWYTSNNLPDPDGTVS
jgi:aldose 1-epimerase